jgi:hypothetical protein
VGEPSASRAGDACDKSQAEQNQVPNRPGSRSVNGVICGQVQLYCHFTMQSA